MKITRVLTVKALWALYLISNTLDLDLEEIAFDDSEAYFQEDFGTPVSDQGQAIFDPLDDIADVNKVPFKIAN